MSQSSGIGTDLAPHRPRDTSGGLVRIVVKLRPEHYDELSNDVREIGSTISAFCRETLVKALRTKESTKPRRPEHQGR